MAIPAELSAGAIRIGFALGFFAETAEAGESFGAFGVRFAGLAGVVAADESTGAIGALAAVCFLTAVFDAEFAGFALIIAVAGF